jgi:hypothetical protein
MGNSGYTIKTGPHKGRGLTFAPTNRVISFRRVAEEFMDAVFELRPSEYAISDESDIRDFTSFGCVSERDTGFSGPMFFLVVLWT